MKFFMAVCLVGCYAANLCFALPVERIKRSEDDLTTDTPLASRKEAKDSVDKVDFALLEYAEKDKDKAIDFYLDTAVQADKFGCGSRLICELHRRPEADLLPEELILKSMFLGKPVPTTASGSKTAKGRGVFQYAAYLGSTAKNEEICAKAFSRCPFDTDTVIAVFRAIGSSPALKEAVEATGPSLLLSPPHA